METTILSPVTEEGRASEESRDDWFMADPILEPDTINIEGDSCDGIPVVKLPKDLRLELCMTWKNALIVKFLGKPAGFGIFQQRLLKLWNLKGKSELINIGVDFYIVMLELQSDYMGVLMGDHGKFYITMSL